MSQTFDSDDEQAINIELGFSVGGILQAIEQDPALLALIERVTRTQNLKLARRVGNTSGKYAQRQLPAAVLKQVPGNQRIF